MLVKQIGVIGILYLEGRGFRALVGVMIARLAYQFLYSLWRFRHRQPMCVRCGAGNRIDSARAERKEETMSRGGV